MSKDFKAALLAMKSLRRHANMMKLKGDGKAKPKEEIKEEPKPDAAKLAGADEEDDDEFFEAYKPFKPKPVSEKMTMVEKPKERSPLARAVDAAEGKAAVKRGPGRPRKE